MCTVAVVVVVFVLLPVLAGCSTMSGLGGTEGGLATEDAAQLSLVVAQTRAQFPELSVRELSYQPREAPERPLEQRMAPALRGKGRSVAPGVQVGKPETVELSLFLDKASYGAGAAEIRVGDRPATRWRIVAFDKRGSATGRFTYMYALTSADGGLRYLVVLGGSFRDEGRSLWGAEGTLVNPGADGRIENWERAYKLDFGFRQPTDPEWREHVSQAVRLFRGLQRDIPALQRLQAEIDDAEQALRQAQQAPAEGQVEGAVAEAEQALSEAEQRYRTAVRKAREDMLRYWDLREKIAESFAAFLRSNYYLWQPRDAQADYFDTWEQVEYHHPRVDQLAEQLAPHVDDPEPLRKRRMSVLEAVRAEDNWNKHPDRGSSQQDAESDRAQGEAAPSRQE